MDIGAPHVPNDRFQEKLTVRRLPMNDKIVGRLVNGPIHRYKQMWPTIVEDDQTKLLKYTWRSCYVNREQRTPLDLLSSLDKSLKQKHFQERGEKPDKIRSVLDKNDSFDYAFIYKNPQDGQPKLVVLEVNYSTQQGIMDLHSKVHPVNSSFLLHGLRYMYDIMIEKKVDPATKRPKYTVSAVDSAAGGKVEIKYLDEKKNPFPNPEQWFPPDDLELIKEASWELEGIDLPLENDKILDLVRKFPIDLGRKNKDESAFLFFNTAVDVNAFLTVAEKEQIAMQKPAESSRGAAQAPAIPAQTAPAAPAQPAAAPAQTPVETPAQVSDTAPVAQKVDVVRPEQPAPPTTPPTPAAAPAAPNPPQTTTPGGTPAKPGLRKFNW